MADFYLEFEKPLSELKRKIEELENFSRSSNIDVSTELQALTVKLEEMTKDIYTHLSPWQRVQMSRHPERPYTLDYIEALFTDFTSLAGDRHFGDDHAVVGGFAMFKGMPVMVIGTQKGRDMKDNVYRNFGWPSPEGYRKAMRLMRLADKAG
ncbi:MAG: acetyl-CoA carboxylase carboxyl transferase subunit alpha, partial [Lentisphaeria bacterium]|nr:acetyl-CoA carboxylase carboxyl transferase subunit alpha [Lentisphaeria bacterium]